MDDEIRELVMRGYETARQVLEVHRPAVRALAQQLLAHESLDAGEIRAVLAAAALPTAAMEAVGDY